MKPCVLLTRSGQQNEPLQSRLMKVGIETQVCPLQTIVSIELTAGELLKIRELNKYGFLIFVSRNAVIHGFKWIDQYWSGLPDDLRCFAVGPGTGNDLAERGINCAFPAHGSSEDLLMLEGLGAVKGERILIVRGRNGREQLKKILETRGADVEYLEVYDRQQTALDAELMAKKLETENVGILVVQSGEALELLSALIDRLEMQNVRYKSINLVVASGRIAEIAKKMGFFNINVSAGAEVESIYSTIVKVYDSIS